MLYEFFKGSTTTEAYNNICQTEGPEVVSYSTIKFWYRKFSSGEEDLSDQLRSGKPITVDKEELKLAISTCSTSTTRQLAADLGSSRSTIARNLHELGFINKNGAEIPHELTPAQKEHRVMVCSDLLARLEAGMRLSQTVTCDEKWIFLDNRKKKRYWFSLGKCLLQHLYINNMLLRFYSVFGGVLPA